jgi:CheY-like chemotaxis protein
MAHILIVDDDVEIAEDMAEVLRGAGHQVSLLHSTRGAAPALAAARPDLLFLDVMFPDDPSAGLSLAIECRRQDALKKVPIVMLSSVNEKVDIQLSDRDIHPKWMPVTRFVEKPIEPDRLLRLVSDLLGTTA